MHEGARGEFPAPPAKVASDILSAQSGSSDFQHPTGVPGHNRAQRVSIEEAVALNFIARK